MNWKSIIATTLLTGIVTVATGVFLFWWQAEKAELTYNSIQSIPFDDASNKLFIQQIEINNPGDKPAENVVLMISFIDEVVQKSKITIDNSIPHKKTINNETIKLEIDSLNPSESANISVLYQSSKLNSDGAKISLRAKGITGRLIGENDNKSKESIGIAIFAAYAGVIAFLLSTARGRAMMPIIAKSLLRGGSLGNSQRNTIASTLSMYGYPEKAKEYLVSNSNRQYWVEADLLTAEAILGDDKQKHDTIKILKVISELPQIIKGSKAITYYNIARLSKVIEADNNQVEEYLDMAKKLDKSEIENRLLRDPVFAQETI